MKAIIPAAGYATRLYPITIDKPKSLLEINGKPLIEYIIEKVCELDNVDEIFIITNDKFYEDFLEWQARFKCGKKIKIINDKTENNESRLGTIGDISYVLKKEGIYDDLLIINSDNLFSFDLKKLIAHFEKRNFSVLCAYDVDDLEIAKNMGSLRINNSKKITYFKEKDPNLKSSLCSTGIYLFPKRIINYIYKYLKEGNSPDKSGEFIEWLYKNEDIYALVFSNEGDYWFDIGSMQKYKEANEFIRRLSEINKK